MPERRVTFSNPKSFTVRDLPVEERPRERLLHLGSQALSSQELIAVLIGRGTAGHSVMVVAQELLARFGSLERVVNASVEELQEVSGLGTAKALQFKACLEIARRVVQEEKAEESSRTESSAIRSAEDVASLVRTLVRNWETEHFYVISLDNRNKVLGVDALASGTLNTTVVHPRETFGVAVARRASQIILAHNHPSGDPTPSQNDIGVSKRLVQAGTLMGIEVLDHVVVSRSGHYSLKDHRVL